MAHDGSAAHYLRLMAGVLSSLAEDENYGHLAVLFRMAELEAALHDQPYSFDARRLTTAG